MPLEELTRNKKFSEIDFAWRRRKKAKTEYDWPGNQKHASGKIYTLSNFVAYFQEKLQKKKAEL